MASKPKDLSEKFVELWSDRKPAPIRAYKFHPIRKWRCDLAWPDIKLAVELHGAVFAAGRHTRGLGITGDAEKMNSAIFLGWDVLVYTGLDLQRKPNQVIEEVETLLQTRAK